MKIGEDRASGWQISPQRISGNSDFHLKEKVKEMRRREKGRRGYDASTWGEEGPESEKKERRKSQKKRYH